MLLFSCKDDDCSGDSADLPVSFDIFLKLETLNGDNFLDKESFDIVDLFLTESEFKFSTGNFEVVERNGINVLQFSSRFQSEVTVAYKNEKISFFKVSVSSSSLVENCSVLVNDYKVLLEDDTSLCGCAIDEVITLPLSI